MAKGNGQWDNRIVGTGDEHPDQLLANPLNWRIHPQFQQDALKGVLDEVGWVQQVIVNKRTGHLIDGHLRVTLAMREESATVPVNYVDLSEDEEKLILATLDPLAGLAVPDNDMYANLIDGLEIDNEFVNELISDIADIPLAEGLTDPDEVPEVQDDPITQTGDLILLGEHRLLCGDAVSIGDVEILFNGGKPRTIFTSPPYYNAREYAHWDTTDEYLSDMVDVVSLAMIGQDIIIVWNIGEQAVHQLDLSSMTSVAFSQIKGLEFVDKICWSKPGAAFDIPRNGHIIKGFYYPAFSWEPILVFRHGEHPRIDEAYRSQLSSDPVDTWSIETVASQNESKGHHCAAFPLSLADKALRCYLPSGGFVYDPFGGSGTTMIAAELQNKKSYMMEIDPHYCDVIVKRWENYTGQEAQRPPEDSA